MLGGFGGSVLLVGALQRSLQFGIYGACSVDVWLLLVKIVVRGLGRFLESAQRVVLVGDVSLQGSYLLFALLYVGSRLGDVRLGLLHVLVDGNGVGRGVVHGKAGYWLRHVVNLLAGASVVLGACLQVACVLVVTLIPVESLLHAFQFLAVVLGTLRERGYERVEFGNLFLGEVVLLVGGELCANLLQGVGGGAAVLVNLLADAAVGVLAADELFEKLVAFVLLGVEEVGEGALCNEHRAQELLVVETDDVGQSVPVGRLLRLLAVLDGDAVEQGACVLVSHALEAHVPFGAVDHAVVGKKRQLAVARLPASGEDVAAVGGSKAVVLAVLRTAEYLDVLVAVAPLARIARSAVVEREADGVEQGRLAAARRTHDAEDG